MSLRTGCAYAEREYGNDSGGSAFEEKSPRDSNVLPHRLGASLNVTVYGNILSRWASIGGAGTSSSRGKAIATGR
jgi:hypothetical protein